MNTTRPAPVAPVAVARDLSLADLRAALAAGWRDFCRAPVFGLFFGGFHVAAGLLLGLALMRWGEMAWLIPAAAGFPLLAPFVAVGLYEVSRRLETGEALSWRAVLGALGGRGDEQILSMGVIAFVAFGFWLIVAHSIFAIFMAESGLGGESLAQFVTPAGLMALTFYAITVVSLPMLVDREVDFLTAIIVSLATVRSNRPVMLGWAALIAVLLTLALVPLFLGLLVALPVLGHATWHLYRRAVRDEPV
jgi:uncharacterized membrane protein